MSNITEAQYNELLLAGLKQIARDAEMLSSGNIPTGQPAYALMPCN